MHKINSFACDITNRFTNHVRKNVTYTEGKAAIIKICFQYSFQNYSENCKRVKCRYNEKEKSTNVFSRRSDKLKKEEKFLRLEIVIFRNNILLNSIFINYPVHRIISNYHKHYILLGSRASFMDEALDNISIRLCTNHLITKKARIMEFIMTSGITTA